VDARGAAGDPAALLALGDACRDAGHEAHVADW
jgi:TPR repeat protein